MSTERMGRLPNMYHLNTYFGGKDKGVCLQVTFELDRGYIQLDRSDASRMIKDLIDYLDDDLPSLED